MRRISNDELHARRTATWALHVFAATLFEEATQAWGDDAGELAEEATKARCWAYELEGKLEELGFSAPGELNARVEMPPVREERLEPPTAFLIQTQTKMEE